MPCIGVDLRGRFYSNHNNLDFDAYKAFVLAEIDMFFHRGVFIIEMFFYVILDSWSMSWCCWSVKAWISILFFKTAVLGIIRTIFLFFTCFRFSYHWREIFPVLYLTGVNFVDFKLWLSWHFVPGLCFSYCSKCVFFFMFSPQHGTTQASELVNLQSFFTANILPELEIKNGECWGYFVHFWYSLY